MPLISCLKSLFQFNVSKNISIVVLQNQLIRDNHDENHLYGYKVLIRQPTKPFAQSPLLWIRRLITFILGLILREQSGSQESYSMLFLRLLGYRVWIFNLVMRCGLAIRWKRWMEIWNLYWIGFWMNWWLHSIYQRWIRISMNHVYKSSLTFKLMLIFS